MGMMINRRRAYGGKSLPYDAEVEYLESVNSEQYIDTGIIVSSPYSIYGKFLAIGEQLPNNAYIFFGAGLDYQYDNIECYTSKAAQYISVLHNGYRDFAYPYNIIPFTVHYRNKEFTVTNGQDTFQYTFTNASVEPLFTMGLFALHRRTWIGSPKPVRCYWFKIEDENGVTLIDLIPVRVGTTGYMYDKVSGTLFGNAGTGDFVLGPDKSTSYSSEIEYLESSGKQIINTGITLQSGDYPTYIIECELLQKNSVYVSSPVGYYIGRATNIAGIAFFRNDSNIVFSFGVNGDKMDTYTGYSLNTRYKIIANSPTGSYVDGTLVGTRYISMTQNSNQSIYLFVNNANGNIWAEYFIGRIYSCQIKINGIIVRDFIPVRVGQVGCLYDQVSKELFYNSGTGLFTLGPDKT